MRPILLLLLLVAPASATQVEPKPLRVATFNCSLNRAAAGELIRDLSTPDDPQARNVAEVIQRVRPDVLLLNEFDYDADGKAVGSFLKNYLAIGQNGAAPIEYPGWLAPVVNTGVASGLDLDNDGVAATRPGDRGYGNDAYGFGLFPGQYGMVLLHKHSLVEGKVRSFHEVRWKDMPGASIPRNAEGVPWFSDDELALVRLSSKTHVDAPLQIGDRVLHCLISHPTPPAFDGPEKRNVRRNADEIRLWIDYINGGQDAAYLNGGRNEEPPEFFVVLGDLNSDPNDGSGDKLAIRRLLSHPRVNTTAPTSLGGAEASRSQGGKNSAHSGPPDQDTADFDDRSVGNLRVDYVLPSVGWRIVDWGVFWPGAGDPLGRLTVMKPTVATSDHRLVWVDLLPAD